MRIRLSSDLEERARSARAPMSVDEFLARFPEVPRDVRDEPTLQEYTRAFGPLLRVAQKPTPCMGDGGDAPHVFYMRLLNDLAIYGIGLAKRDRTLVRLSPCSSSIGCSPLLSRAPSCPGGRRARLVRAALRPKGGLSANYVRAGPLDQAWPHACKGLDLAREQQEARSREAQPRCLSWVSSTPTPPVPMCRAGRDVLQGGADASRELGIRPVVAHCHLGLGKLYRRDSKQQDAQQQPTTATTMFRQMDMRLWPGAGGGAIGGPVLKDSETWNRR